jgi:hypothetical protein
VKCLTMSRSVAISNGRRIRETCFEDRSNLPASAACVVASGARETLGALLSSAVSLRLFEPVLPTPGAWRAILRDATLFRYRGTVADAAIVLRAPDARALARAVFGETALDDSFPAAPLSPLENDVLGRVAAAIGASLPAVCGVRDGAAVERVAEISGFTTFFELILERPVRASIGVAVSRDPAPDPRGTLGIHDLEEVEISLDVRIDVGSFPATLVAGLTPGDVLPFEGPAPRGRLRLDGRTLAYGMCGVRRGWYALTLEGTGTAI